MAYICRRCDEAHGDGLPCPYIHSKDSPIELAIEKLQRRQTYVEDRLKKVENFFKAFKDIG